jgi:pimeloyl-ACP methyl ester carboxylesterase
MRVALIHGNPETTMVWDDLKAELAKLGVTDVTAVERPGFGTPSAADFDASGDSYRKHLAENLKKLGADGTPVHLVGHDWVRAMQRMAIHYITDSRMLLAGP